MVAAREIVPLYVPADGEVIETVGGVPSAVVKVISTVLVALLAASIDVILK